MYADGMDIDMFNKKKSNVVMYEKDNKILDDVKVNCNSYTQIWVIIPVYNCISYLKQAVESITLQSYSSIRIVLVDDGSTDGSSELCDALKKQNTNILALHQKNGGVSSARNLGMEYIFAVEKNEEAYISFLDADDAWKDNWIDNRIITLIENKFDLIGLQSCYCDETLTRRKNVINMQEGEYFGGNSAVWIHGGQHFGAMLYKINLLKKYRIRFDNIKMSEDKIFSMQCRYLAKNIYLINRIMYLYRQNSISAVHTRKRGIVYFEPIIDAYIKSDKEMLCWKNDNRGELKEGRILAEIYIMDMIEEELENWNGKNHIIKLLEQRNDYIDILENSTESKQLQKRWTELKKYKAIFYIRRKLVRLIRWIYYFPGIKKGVDKWRYSIKI